MKTLRLCLELRLIRIHKLPLDHKNFYGKKLADLPELQADLGS